jgi:hypothetical protein
MATQAEMERLVGMAIFDEQFRDYILRDPEGAAKSVRITLTPSQADAIRDMDHESIDALAMLTAKEASRTPSGSPEGFWLANAGTDSKST